MKKILIAIIAVLLAGLISVSVFVAVKGKSIAVSAIEKSLNRKVALESIKFHMPFAVSIDNLDIENLLKARSIVITPSLLGFFSGRIVLNEVKLINPQLSIIRQEDGSFNLPLSKETSKGKSNVVVSGIVIDKGTLNFIDKKIDPSGFEIKVSDIYLSAHTSVLSFKPMNVAFDLKSNITSGQNNKTGSLIAKGWVDLLRKNMKGRVELNDLDAVSLLPYYKNLVSSPMEKGRLFFSSDLNAKNNDLTADCHLSVKDVVLQKKEGKKNDFNISVLDIFTSSKGADDQSKEINLDFVIHTKLDNPRFDRASLVGSVVTKNLADQMINNPEETINKFKNIGKQFESLGKSFLKSKEENIPTTTINQEAQVNQEIQQNTAVQQNTVVVQNQELPQGQ